MTYIKNQRTWKRWHAKHFKYQEVQPEQPKGYPCFAYLGVGSFGMEEYSAHFLYYPDIGDMFSKMTSTLEGLDSSPEGTRNE